MSHSTVTEGRKLTYLVRTDPGSDSKIYCYRRGGNFRHSTTEESMSHRGSETAACSSAHDQFLQQHCPVSSTPSKHMTRLPVHFSHFV